MAMGLQSLSFENRFSTLWRCLYMFYSILRGVFALLLAEYGGNATLNQGRTIGAAVVTFVAQKRARSRQVRWQCCAPLWPDCCPSVSNSSTGRISPSQTACGLEFSPPLVWPIARGTTDKPQTTDLTMTPCGSAQGERLIKWDNDRTIYKRRKEVERLFRRLKGYRRIFSRFEKLDVMYSAFLNFALIVDMIKC